MSARRKSSRNQTITGRVGNKDASIQPKPEASAVETSDLEIKHAREDLPRGAPQLCAIFDTDHFAEHVFKHDCRGVSQKGRQTAITPCCKDYDGASVTHAWFGFQACPQSGASLTIERKGTSFQIPTPFCIMPRPSSRQARASIFDLVRPASGICRFRVEAFDHSVIKNQVGFLSATTAPRFPIGLSGPTVESLRVWRSSSPFNSAPMQTT